MITELRDIHIDRRLYCVMTAIVNALPDPPKKVKQPNTKALAKAIVDAIMPPPIQRIALKRGRWPEGEIDCGGYCREALITMIDEVITKHYTKAIP